MNAEPSRALAIALEADEAEQLNNIVRARRPDDFDALVALATSPQPVDASYRRRALYALGRWGDRSVVPRIVAVLPQLDDGARIAAIDALAHLPSADARRAIQAHAADTSPHVRKLVAQALASFEDARSSRTLNAIASDDPEEWVRAVARKLTRDRDLGLPADRRRG